MTAPNKYESSPNRTLHFCSALKLVSLTLSASPIDLLPT